MIRKIVKTPSSAISNVIINSILPESKHHKELNNVQEGSYLHVYDTDCPNSRFVLPHINSWIVGASVRFWPGAIRGLSFLFVLAPFSEGLSPGSAIFLVPKKPTFPNSNSTRIADPHENQLSLMCPPNCQNLFIRVVSVILFRLNIAIRNCYESQ